MPSDTPASMMSEPLIADNSSASGPHVQVSLTFWQHPVVQNLLPFATSIVFHAVLILLLIFLITFATTRERVKPVAAEKILRIWTAG